MKFFQVLAHESEELVEQAKPSLEEVIRTNSLNFTLYGLGLLLFLAVVAVFLKKTNEKVKYLLFGAITSISVATTVYLAGSTIYLNQVSVTGGPIHWHADFEIWYCGQKVEIKDPEGFSNKVGTEVIHEHNDDRIHIEGVILNRHDTSIGHFIEQIGGQLHQDHMAIPTENGLLEVENGQTCDGQAGILQIFVYRTEGDSFYQQKLIGNPQDYIISPFSQVPPGDCIIIEVDRPKDKTDKLCTFYKVAAEKGEIHGR